MKKTNVFVVGHGTGYANWIPNKELVNKIEDADLVLFTGGEDVDPELYNEPVGRYTSYSKQRDKREVDAFNKAKALNKKMLGICRGAQLLCVLSGGRLVQHQDNSHYYHNITTSDNQVLLVNSLHHQAQYPYNLNEKEYKLLAWSENLSNFHLDGEDKEISDKPFKEAEIVYYPKTQCLGIQCHPEMMYNRKVEYAETFVYFENILNNFLNNKL